MRWDTAQAHTSVPLDNRASKNRDALANYGPHYRWLRFFGQQKVATGYRPIPRSMPSSVVSGLLRAPLAAAGGIR